MGRIIYESIRKAQNGDKDCMYALVKQFMPLINGAARRLVRVLPHYEWEDAIADFQLSFIKTVKSMKLERLHGTSDAEMVSYLRIAVRNSFIRKIKNAYNRVQQVSFEDLSEVEMNTAELKNSTKDDYDGLTQEDMKKVLSPDEFFVLNGYAIRNQSIALLAVANGKTRQAVNRTKLKAIQKLRSAW